MSAPYPSQPQQTVQQKISVIQQQNTVFDQALQSGKISQSQYNLAMSYQNQQLQQLQHQQSQAEIQGKISTIQSQNQVFEQARDSGKITSTEYTTAMGYQNKQLLQLQKQFNEGNKQILISEFNYVSTIPVAKNDQEAIAKGAQIYITPDKQTEIFSQIGKEYNQYKQDATLLNTAQAKQDANVAKAVSMGLPEAVGYTYDLSKFNVPEGHKVTGYVEEPMVGPLQPGETRPYYLQVTTEPIQQPTEDSGKLFENFMEPKPDTKGVLAPTAGPHPARMYTPEEYEVAKSNALSDVKTFALVTGSVVAAPLLGPTGTLIAAGSGVGLTQAIKTVSQVANKEPLTLITVEEGFEGATTGIIFSGVGKAAMGGLEATRFAPVVQGAGKGITKTATSVAGQAGVNAGIGGAGGLILSGGNPEAALEGAAFGAGLSVAGRAAAPVVAKVPVPKYGKVTVPLEPTGSAPESATWEGIYLSKGSEAKPIIGSMTKVPKGATISDNYVPSSNIESRVAVDVMGKAGYPENTIQTVNDVRTIMRTTQDTKPTSIDKVLPTETGTLNKAGVQTVKDYVLAHPEQVDMLYGSYVTKPQLAKTFEYVKDGKSALRTPADIDIQLTTGESGAVKFTAELAAKLKQSGADVRVSQEKPTLIEANVGEGKYAHAVDIHYSGEVPTNVVTPTRDVAWGFKFNKPTIVQEGIQTMALNEQGLRKGAAIIGFKETQTVGPQEWRIKDVPDFFQAQKTLLDTMPSAKTGKATEAFNRAQQYYGVENLADQPVRMAYSPKATEQYQASRARSSTPLLYSAAAINTPSSVFSSEPLSPETTKTSTNISPSISPKATIYNISSPPNASPKISTPKNSNPIYNIPSASIYQPNQNSPPLSTPKNSNPNPSSTIFGKFDTPQYTPPNIKDPYTPYIDPTYPKYPDPYTPPTSDPTYPRPYNPTTYSPPYTPSYTPPYTPPDSPPPSPPKKPSSGKPDKYYNPLDFKYGLDSPESFGSTRQIGLGKRKKEYPILGAEDVLKTFI